MDVEPRDGDRLPNYDILQRLAAAWNPTKVVGKVCILEGRTPERLHICFVGQINGQYTTVVGTAIPRSLFLLPENRRLLARYIRDYFATALQDHFGRERTIAAHKE